MSRNLKSVPTLDPSQIVLFCEALIHYPQEPQEQYERRILKAIKLLKTPLTRPGFVSRLYLASQSSYTPLCPLHKPLNASIVHSIFSLVAVEVGVRMNSLIVGGRDRTGHQTWDHSILNLRSLHGLWLPPDVFHKTFGASLELLDDEVDDPKLYYNKWPHQKSRCEACVLTHIAGDLYTLLDLRMVIKSRMYSKLVKRHGMARLWTWIETWIDRCWHEWLERQGLPHEVERHMELNELQATRLKELRKEITRERRSRNEYRLGKRSKHRTRDNSSEATSKSYSNRAESETTSKKDKSRILPIGTGTAKTEGRNFQPVHELQGAHAVPQKYPPSDPSRSAEILNAYATAERDNETEVVVEQQAYDVENEIIDSYLALISTPFLPGMGIEQHEKTERTLSVSYAQLKANLNGENPIPPGRSPEEVNKPSAGPSKYSESIYSTDDPHPVKYTDPRAAWTNKELFGTEAENRHRTTARITQASARDSWTDVSVVDSENGIAQPRNYPNQRFKRYQPAQVDTITEEIDTSRYTTWGGMIASLTPTTQQPQPKYATLRNLDTHGHKPKDDAMDISPVSVRHWDPAHPSNTSPVSMMSTPISPKTSGYKRRHDQLPTPEPELIRHRPGSSGYNLSQSNDRHQTNGGIRRHHTTKHAKTGPISSPTDKMSRSRSQTHGKRR